MKAWLRRWLGIPDREVVYTSPVPLEKSCAVDGHEWGAVKQWVRDDGTVFRSRRCLRCSVLEGDVGQGG
jgi:hypothetical protein